MVETAHAEAMLTRWQEALSLQIWDISCVWVDAKTIEQTDDTDVWADVRIDRERWEAKITVALDRTAEEVERTILHECLHLLLAEWKDGAQAAKSYCPAALFTLLTEQRDEAEERAVTLLERAMWKIRRTT